MFKYFTAWVQSEAVGSLEIGKKWLKIAFYFTERDMNLPDETFNAHFLHANKHLTCFKPVFMVYSRSQMLFRWSAWRLSATQSLDSYHLAVRCGAHLYMLQFKLMLISVQPDCRSVFMQLWCLWYHPVWMLFGFKHKIFGILLTALHFNLQSTKFLSFVHFFFQFLSKREFYYMNWHVSLTVTVYSPTIRLWPVV